MQSTYYVVVAMFISLLLIATFVKVDIIVSGTGRLTTATPPIMLQAMDQAIIRELPVQPGDVVTKGQVLATLDPTFAQADVTSLTSQQQSLQAQIRRLEAELNGTPFDPGATPNSDEQLQLSLFQQRQAQYASQLHGLDETIEQLRANIRTTQDHRGSLEKQLKIARDVEGMRSAMMEKQVGSKLNFLEAQAARMRIEQDFQDTGNRIGELDHELQSKEADRQTFADQWRHQVLDSLVSARTDEAKIGQAMSKAALMNNMVVITAPDDGVILDVARGSVGSVVRAAEPLVTMVQSNAKLVAEITINSSDIGYTKAGDEVVVKVDAFPFQRHGFMHGRLAYVSEESFSPSGGSLSSDGAVARPSSDASGAFHRGRVDLVDTHLDNMPPGARLIPGMTMSAEIKVGRRSVISYFLNPLTRVLGESIREP
ncbi:MAG: HlyD family type I secretion periplasmic adaptor subunit [Rhodospirillaceae bacterium]|nr:MAG: HlyD family type I secretion periplasmic adaptor subunit [Rhodospirillaceae bacterium]